MKFIFLFTDYQKCIQTRQQLDAQQNENTMVKEVSYNNALITLFYFIIFVNSV